MNLQTIDLNHLFNKIQKEVKINFTFFKIFLFQI